MTRIAEAPPVWWNTTNTAVLTEGHHTLIADSARFDGVRVIGVDEHMWHRTHRGDKYVTVILDLTPNKDKTGTYLAAAGHGRRPLRTGVHELAHRPPPGAGRESIEAVAMDGFTGFKSAAAEEPPGASTNASSTCTVNQTESKGRPSCEP